MKKDTAQFYEGLLRATLEDLELREWDKGYGMRFNAYMRVQGRTGVTAVVKTGWMMTPGRRPSLSSAMPDDTRLNVVHPPVPSILPPGQKNSSDWARLWAWANDAGTHALREAVPTPVFPVGLPPAPEGESGLGIVRVLDANSEFAQWLTRDGPGRFDERNAAVVHSPAPTISLERGVAWAWAVAKVLTLNGFAVEVEENLT